MKLERLIENEPLARHTSWRIGGPARYYLEAMNVAELQTALEWAAGQGLPVFVLGGGTNLLVRDAGFPGLALRYRAQQWRIESADAVIDSGMQELRVPSTKTLLGPADGRLYVEAGAPMTGTVRRVAAQGWGGMEWAEGLPGAVGGAVYGNAGCYGGDIAGVLERAWLLIDGAVAEWPVAQFAYGYRTSRLKQDAADQQTARPIVLAAELRLQRADPVELAATMAAIAAERKSKTPWGSSCGSVFKNPPGDSAGRLIEAAGLKGARSGGAEISQRHANYIINLGGAHSADVLRLIELARSEVLRQFGVELELEVQVV